MQVEGQDQEQGGYQGYQGQREAQVRLGMVHVCFRCPAGRTALFHDRSSALRTDQVFAAHQLSLRPAPVPGHFGDVGPSMPVSPLD